MDPNQVSPGRDRRIPSPISAAQAIQPSSPRLFFSAAAAASPGGGGGASHRRIAIAVDLSDESAYAIRWAVRNYLRPGDAVVLLHVRPTSVLYGADWGAIDPSAAEDGDSEESKRKLEDEFDAFTASKAQEVAQPLVEARIPFKIHIVKDHDMKERLCIEVERLGIGAVIMGSRGFGAARSSSKAGLGSVSDYCVHHCACPVVVVRFPDDGSGAGSGAEDPNKQDGPDRTGGAEEKPELHPLPQRQH
uniref:UspA domain-containing protein n=1 Tax=Ananas comosus var. bracteatus TaxID=296719 RepID=A0A6V7PNR0_ANACO|nr:unnamed protein product [Ananas comosus var. bracteatus]